MTRFAFLFLIPILAWSAVAEESRPRIRVDIEQGPNPWSHLAFLDDPNHFQFAIVTDRTGGHRQGVFQDAIVKLNLLRPEFVMSIGDLIEGGSTDVDRVNSEWDEFTGFIDNLKMPFFYVPGNHDISNPTMAGIWKKRFGRAYYHFLYRNVLFLCLNSEDPKFHLGDEQIDYFRAVLQENPNVRWTLVFLHRPFWAYSAQEIEESNWDRFEQLLEGRKFTVFAGHWHNYVKYVRNDRDHIVLATTGGGSRLRGPAWVEFDHVVWVTMSDDGPVIANLMLEGIWDEDVRTEAMASATSYVFGGRAVRGGSKVLEDPASGETTLKMVIENTADVPMKIRGRFEPHDALRVVQATLEKEIAPNRVEEIPVRVTWKNPDSLRNKGPLTFKYTIVYHFPSHQPMEIEAKRTMILDQVFPVAPPSGAIEVDGDHSEWADLRFRVNHPGQVYRRAHEWKGEKDSSFAFDLRADEEFLYLAVRSRDDILVFNPDRAPDDKDGLRIRIDSRPRDEWGKGAKPEGESGILDFVMTLTDNADEMVLQDRENLPEGVRFGASRQDDGFFVEVGIPTVYLNRHQGGEWNRVRVNVGQYDRDLSGRTKSLWWRPPWDSASTYAGSGTFSRR